MEEDDKGFIYFYCHMEPVYGGYEEECIEPPPKRRALDFEMPPFGAGTGVDTINEDDSDEDIFKGPQFTQVGLPTRQAE